MDVQDLVSIYPLKFYVRDDIEDGKATFRAEF